MFEHLDDPDSIAPGRWRVAVVTAARQRQRRRRRVASAVGGSAVAAAVALPAVYLRGQADELEQVVVDGLDPVTTTVPVVTVAADPADPSVATVPAPALAGPLNILVLGLDTQPPPDDVVGSRPDTIAVVRVDPAGPTMTVLSVPRDLYVPMADGAPKRINAAYPLDGRDPSAMVEQVGRVLDVPINHVVEIEFDGFARLVDLAGGVDMAFDLPVRDVHAGFTADAGCVRLDGSDALAYVRSRYLETLVGGAWATDPTSDFGRVARQQQFGRALLATVFGGDYSRMDELQLVTDVLDDVTVDRGLDVDGLRAIFAVASAVEPSAVRMLDLTSAVRVETVDDMTVLAPDLVAVREITAPLRGEPGSTDAPTAGGSVDVGTSGLVPTGCD